jgi:hypothetical protein
MLEQYNHSRTASDLEDFRVVLQFFNVILIGRGASSLSNRNATAQQKKSSTVKIRGLQRN